MDYIDQHTLSEIVALLNMHLDEIRRNIAHLNEVFDAYDVPPSIPPGTCASHRDQMIDFFQRRRVDVRRHIARHEQRRESYSAAINILKQQEGA